MVQTSHVLLALKDFKKAQDFFLHLGFQPEVSAKMRDESSPEILDGRLAPEPDQVCVLRDDRGFSMDLTIWYDTMKRYFGRSDLICLRVDDLDAVWASLENFPGVRLLTPPSEVSQEMEQAIENLQPGRFAIVSVDLDREDDNEQVIELIQGLVPDHLA